MANHKSAKKRARQDVKKRERNKGYLSGVKTSIKGFEEALKKGDAEQAGKLLVSAQSSLQKAACKGILHRNTASRKVGRLANALKAIQK